MTNIRSEREGITLYPKDITRIIFQYYQSMTKNWTIQGFPGGAVVKNPPANAGDTGSSPGQGRSHLPQDN